MPARNLPQMMHIARELCGGQICVTPDVAAFERPETGQWLEKFYTVNDELAGRGPPQAAGLRARSAELRLCRPPPDLPALRPVAALRASGRGLPQLRLERPAGFRAEGGGPVGQGAGQDDTDHGRQRRQPLVRDANEQGRRVRTSHDRAQAHPPLQHQGHLSRAEARQRPLPGRGGAGHDGVPARPGRARTSTRASRCMSATPRSRPPRPWPTSRC